MQQIVGRSERRETVQSFIERLLDLADDQDTAASRLVEKRSKKIGLVFEYHVSLRRPPRVGFRVCGLPAEQIKRLLSFLLP